MIKENNKEKYFAETRYHFANVIYNFAGKN